MSLRYDRATAADCMLRVIGPQDDPDEHQLDLDEGGYALVIGDPDSAAYAVEGTPQDLLRFAQRILDLVTPDRVRHAD